MHIVLQLEHRPRDRDTIQLCIESQDTPYETVVVIVKRENAI